jgi:SAM-dependent methyltransferase
LEGTRSLQAGASARSSPTRLPSRPLGEIDPFVQNIIAATNGMLYISLIGKLTDYPIPYLRLPSGEGKRFLEIGCNWGRWCIAAARLGYRPVGIDPSLKGIRAARQVAQQLGIEAHYVVADGRYLPFANGTFDQVFSYSVLQHFPTRMPASHCARPSVALIRELSRANAKLLWHSLSLSLNPPRIPRGPRFRRALLDAQGVGLDLPRPWGPLASLCGRLLFA